ncbi:NACHT domain-containing protein [Desulfosarcina sp. OttesenSCG-928-A07]|nr:NACHT domain-containing protein [Desulfosarcina sp. OttesenSCG-928-A07]
MHRITAFQINTLTQKLESHLQHQSPRHSNRFHLLAKLVKDSDDGTFTRSEMNDALFPGMKPQSIKSELQKFKTALNEASIQAGLGSLKLVMPSGRGGPKQRLYLEIEKIPPSAVPASTTSNTEFIDQRASVPAWAFPVSGPVQIFVSFAGADQVLAERLIKKVEAVLKSYKDELAGRIKLWRFRSETGENGISAGEDDDPAIKKALERSVAGMLLVSPNACASKYIQETEWRFFRNEQGERLRPFITVALARIAEDKHKLGVLDRINNKARPQTYDLLEKGKTYSWEECQKSNPRKTKFAEKVADELLRLFRKPSYPPEEKKISPSCQQLEASPDKHVESRFRRIDLQQAIQDERESSDKQKEGFLLMPAMMDWACNPKEPPYAVLLGEYGMGKTWNSQLLALELEKLVKAGQPVPTPIYLDLRKVVEEKSKLLGGDLPLLEEFLDRASLRNTPPGTEATTGRTILEMVQRNGALLIFDGLDEVLAHNRDTAWEQQFIDLLFSALPHTCWPEHLNSNTQSSNPGKLLLTCRTHYFKSTQRQNEQLLGVGREKQEAARPRGWQLLPFKREQVLNYLRRHLPQDPETVFDIIASVHNLQEVSSRPQGLKMVCDQVERLEEAKRLGKRVNGSSIYAWMVEKWLARDVGKHQLQERDKKALMQDLALMMWMRGAREISWDILEEWFSDEWLHDGGVRERRYKNLPENALLTDLRNATFLIRPGEQNFAFAHTSILEYFLALRLHRSLEQDEREIWNDLNPSHESIVFLFQHHELCDAYKQKKVRNTLVKYLGNSDGDEAARISWLELFLLDPKTWQIRKLDISGLNLEERRFSNLVIDILRADNAKLAESHWNNCYIKESSWKKANCRQICFEHIKGEKADFSSANLFGGRWLEVQIPELVLDNAQLTSLQTLKSSMTLPTIQSNAEPKWTLHLPMHSGSVNGCAISADGKIIVTASYDNTARLWNPQGECIAVLKGHQGGVRGCAISFDAKTVVTVSSDKIARLWNLQGGCMAELKGHQDRVRGCAISSDGKTIVTASGDKTARLWNLQGECTTVLKEHQGGVRGCAIAVGAKTIVTASSDKTARLCNLQGECIVVLKGHQDSVRGCAISFDAKTIITASSDKTARLWNLQGECTAVLKGHQGWVRGCAISACGEIIVTASSDKTARLWNPKGECMAVLKGHQGGVFGCAISFDAKTIVTVSSNHTAHLWNPKGECMAVLKGHTGLVFGCAISADGNIIVTASSDNTTRLWNPKGECIAVLKGHQRGVFDCTISPDGKVIVTASDDKTVRLWNGVGKCIAVLKGHGGGVLDCAISSDGKTIVTASSDHTAHLWNREGECTAVLTGHGDWVNGCAISADGKMILTASSDHTARLWNRDGECTSVLKGHQGRVNGCAISDDGKMILTTSSDHTARLWNREGECIAVLKGHEGWVRGCAISADGEVIVTVSSDNTVRLWSKKGETIRCELVLHPDTETLIWLDAKTQTLRIDGPDWHQWQLHHPDENIPNLPGPRIADFGPMGHEKLANAEEWQFWPRDDIRR